MPDNPETRQHRIDRLGFDYLSQPKRTISSCNLCGNQTFIVLTHRDRYRYPAQAYGCKRCGLVFLNPVMTEVAYEFFYTKIYRPLVSAYHGRLIDAKTIQAEQRVYGVERAEFLKDFIESRQSRTLLDIGGSTGVVAHFFAQHFGLSATVLDPAPLEIEQAQQLGLRTITALLEDYEPKNQKFDLIIFCQTVDHLLDMTSAMNKARTLLNEGGLLFLDIVDFRAAYFRNNSIEEGVKVDHPYYFTEETVTAYLIRSGFQILRTDYAADHLHIGFVCQAAEPEPEYLPPENFVEALWREVRMVQNSAWMSEK